MGTLMLNGPNRNVPAPRSSSDPNTLGESNRGTHSQAIVPSRATSAPVGQSDRNAYWAIGVNGEGAAALCAAPVTPASAFGFWAGSNEPMRLAAPRPSGVLLLLTAVAPLTVADLLWAAE